MTDVRARIPRRPQVPGVPGVPLPDPRLPGDSDARLLAAELDRKAARPVSEISALSRGHDDEEPTNPRVSFPRDRVGPPRAPSAPNDPAIDGAKQLAAIVAAWEEADAEERALLTEFAKRLGRGPRK